MKKAVLFFILALFPISNSFAATTLGSGFVCEGTSLFKAGKVVTYTKAKSTLVKTIEKLKEKLEDAPKNKKQGIKNKIAAAKQSKVLVTACSKGTLSPNQVDALFTSLAGGTGTYSGPYSGLVNGFISLTGNVTAVFSLQGTTLTTVLTIGGNVGNALNAQPLSFQGDVGGVAFPAKFFLQGTFLGNVVLNIGQDGHITVTNDVPSKSANFDGQFSGQSITATIGGVYSGVSYTGNCTLTKTP